MLSDILLMKKQFKVGSRVVPSEYGRVQHIVQKRVNRGTVVSVSNVSPAGYAGTVTVQWDCYKRAHSYAACFIDPLMTRGKS
ncbi:hypothetical protein Hden_1539 [Hyphomicrobium denitrificans ATCC 51888]|uniref:Uncharacterized protein n=1 Tax=Hyphomicrobium denitrificans (strain ATCC 51888 / DSM 1869 / NCIMB 11706 / TK 0415) TaxID=582899 RepID=D8JQ25_HYPDA|nr:hypothetical protein [Hyphomicrobium denitrificans]ADJ21946.1 hypothetical protein Hden_0119 [Hyphomicrobium denitrificans ATCC 51888]ADJ23351.1 hypothetical protein Hden_1539 [Hyphomicrobium denitrificans ATCC 51888]